MEVKKMQVKNRRNRKGQTMAEYAIIVALIALAVIGAVQLLGGSIENVFSNAATQLEENTPDE